MYIYILLAAYCRDGRHVSISHSLSINSLSKSRCIPGPSTRCVPSVRSCVWGVAPVRDVYQYSNEPKWKCQEEDHGIAIGKRGRGRGTNSNKSHRLPLSERGAVCVSRGVSVRALHRIG